MSEKWVAKLEARPKGGYLEGRVAVAVRIQTYLKWAAKEKE
jgi:hypothetical protein